MAIDFPNAPTDGQTFTSGTKTWIYSLADTKWYSGGGLVGPTGPTGPTGATGPTGVQGPSGTPAGVGFYFNILTTDADPSALGQYQIKFNSSSLSTVTQIYMDTLDWNLINQSAFIESFDDSTSTVKGYLYITPSANYDTQFIYRITGLTTATGYYKVAVQYVSGSDSWFPVTDDVLFVKFSRTGDLGTTGATGPTGVTGATGVTGPQPTLGTATPQALGTAAAGTSASAAHEDHVHSSTLTLPSIDNIDYGYTTTATNGTTTTLLVTSNRLQRFTGTSTQTVQMPVTSTLATGIQYEIMNRSTGLVTVQSSGANTIAIVQPNTVTKFTVIGTTLTTAADWMYETSGLATMSNIDGYATRATTGGGTLTLTKDSSPLQIFTGALNDTLVLPVASTLSLGHKFRFVNNSVGATPVQSSGLNTIITAPANSTYDLVCINTGVTTAAGWTATFVGPSTSGAGTIHTGTGSAVLANTPTLITPNIGAATGTSLATTGALSTSAGAITAVGGSVTARAAATQDAVILTGRAGGTSTFGVTLTPTTLTASRTQTLPDVAGNIVVDANPALTLSTAAGNTTINGTLTTNIIRETPTAVTGNTVAVNIASGTSIQAVSGMTGNITVNITNPLLTAGIYTISLLVTQGATGYYPSVLNITAVAQTIKWQGGTAPTPTSSAGKIDLFSFILYYNGSAWTVFGSSNLNY